MQQWHNDINDMHKKFGVHDWVREELNKEDKDWSRLNKFLQFRINFLKEELNETEEAFNNKDAAEVVDGLIDLCVIAIGTLDAFDVDAQKTFTSLCPDELPVPEGEYIVDELPICISFPAVT